MPLGIKKITFATLTFSNITLYIGFLIWRIMFNNFAVESVGVDAGAIGWIQSVRELPGLLDLLADHIR